MGNHYPNLIDSIRSFKMLKKLLGYLFLKSNYVKDEVNFSLSF